MKEAARNFWQLLQKPIYALAPMADVTDAAYRRLIAGIAKPDILFTEFVSCDGLCSPGRDNLTRDLIFDEAERPIVAQLFGSKPENFYKSARFVRELGFDGIDINMGCPDKNVCKQGAGAALIQTPELANEIIMAAKEGARGLPVSVKTRIGFNSIVIEEWVGQLLKAQPVAITLHLRTRKEMSKVPAHWDRVAQVASLCRDRNTILLGNGDVSDLDHADRLVRETGVDGIMLSRAIFGNPWLFDRSLTAGEIPFEQRFAVMVRHAQLYEELFADRKSFLLMRKHLCSYVSGIKGAKELRMEIQQVNNALDVASVLERFRSKGPVTPTSG